MKVVVAHGCIAAVAAQAAAPRRLQWCASRFLKNEVISPTASSPRQLQQLEQGAPWLLDRLFGRGVSYSSS